MGARLTVVDIEDNIGFGPANNQGVLAASGENLVFISNDVVPAGDYITPILEALKLNPQDLIGAELFDFDTGWNRFGAAPHIPYLGGWCVATTDCAWQELGGWDERFVPCDYEDVDLSLTAVTMGRHPPRS
jgi:GT2 family glycosyltransferase